MTAWKEVKKAGCCSDLPPLPAGCKRGGPAPGSWGDANVTECVSTGLHAAHSAHHRAKLGSKAALCPTLCRAVSSGFALESKKMVLPSGHVVAQGGCREAPAASPQIQVELLHHFEQS